ncbi:hypothetical protein SAMN05421805_106104 [Saccharopolyspora antimicrobica]|uniref:Uncharacterized protein n=1 Tax=Saccharopolyspora antimicrobica TaxID=455193 RepID=A0A1I5B3M8_9PSEU|nr:hypothetical protein [Saccharopolyspora antimicrobica]SFN69326.1 hypothetical protein SAMN05421805_106104 [Saccharopolyspora antimicrobica]
MTGRHGPHSRGSTASAANRTPEDGAPVIMLTSVAEEDRLREKVEDDPSQPELLMTARDACHRFDPPGCTGDPG